MSTVVNSLNCIDCDVELYEDDEDFDDFYDAPTDAWYCEQCYIKLLFNREKDEEELNLFIEL